MPTFDDGLNATCEGKGLQNVPDICCPTVAKMWLTVLYHPGIFLTLYYRNSYSSVTAFISNNQSHGSFYFYVIRFLAGFISVCVNENVTINNI